MGNEKKDRKSLFRLFQNAATKDDAPGQDASESEIVFSDVKDAPEDDTSMYKELQSMQDMEQNNYNNENIIVEHSAEDIMQIPENYLEALRREMFPQLSWEEYAYYSNFMLNGKEADQGEKKFLEELQVTAKRIIEAREQRKADKPEPVNAHICIKIPKGKMQAWIFAFPPENGGKEISEDLVVDALSECNIVYGLEDATINKIIYQKVYLKLAVIAHGTAAVDGVDGRIEDHFPRIQRSSFEEIENAELKDIDFGSLDWIHPISAGDLICDVTLPVVGKDGHMVTGETIQGRKIENFSIPNGSNTTMNPERTALISRINGTLYYEDDKFHVKEVLNILSDVDQSVGNVDTIGNLDIRGDIMNGFVVQATGNIEIRGMVGNSKIIAGGDVKIGMGVRGNGDASIECGGDLSCVYLESCAVKCHGSIRAESIINSNVMSDDEVDCKKIIGGTVSALNRINAKVIGNNQHRPVIFNLGITQRTLTNKMYLERREKDLQGEVNQTVKNIRFLRNKSKLGSVEKEMLDELQQKNLEQEKDLEEVKKALAEINETINEFSECELVAQNLYPPVTVTIRSDAIVINREQSMCRVWSDKGEIRMT